MVDATTNGDIKRSKIATVSDWVFIAMGLLTGCVGIGWLLTDSPMLLGVTFLGCACTIGIGALRGMLLPGV